MKVLSVILTFLIASPALGQGALGSDEGRYVFGQVADGDNRRYMLDTESGRLWTMVVSETGAVALEPIPYGSLDGSIRLSPADAAEEEAAFQRRVDAREAAMSNSVRGSVEQLLSGNQVIIRVDGTNHLETLILNDAGKYGGLEPGDRVVFSRFENEIIDIVVDDQ